MSAVTVVWEYIEQLPFALYFYHSHQIREGKEKDDIIDKQDIM